MKWKDASEIVTGLSIQGRLDANAINPDDLFPPYGEIIPLLRDGKDRADITMKVGFAPVDTCIHAVDSINGSLSPLEWLKTVELCASRAKAGIDLEKVSRDLKDGKEIDVGSILAAATKVDLGYRDMTPMSQITGDDNVWVKTGYGPIDKYTGGIPDACLTVVGASPGVGKTTFMLKLAKCMVRKYKKKKVALFTLEMTMGQITARLLNIDKEVTKEEKDRILLNEDAYNINEVYAIAGRTCAQNSVAMIGIDFADLLVESEQSEAVMGKIYRTCSMLAKKVRVPVVLISQLNREVYKGGEPRVNHLRYSGMAEAMSALILLIHNPNTILADFATESSLTRVEGRGYVIVGKSRFGFKGGSPGAIMIEWDGLAGWGDREWGYTPMVA